MLPIGILEFTVYEKVRVSASVVNTPASCSFIQMLQFRVADVLYLRWRWGSWLVHFSSFDCLPLVCIVLLYSQSLSEVQFLCCNLVFGTFFLNWSSAYMSFVDTSWHTLNAPGALGWGNASKLFFRHLQL